MSCAASKNATGTFAKALVKLRKDFEATRRAFAWSTGAIMGCPCRKDSSCPLYMHAHLRSRRLCRCSNQQTMNSVNEDSSGSFMSCGSIFIRGQIAGGPHPHCLRVHRCAWIAVAAAAHPRAAPRPRRSSPSDLRSPCIFTCLHDTVLFARRDTTRPAQPMHRRLRA